MTLNIDNDYCNNYENSARVKACFGEMSKYPGCGTRVAYSRQKKRKISVLDQISTLSIVEVVTSTTTTKTIGQD